MSESQQDIDALLAEVNALAEEAVASIADGEECPPMPPVRPPRAVRPGSSTATPPREGPGGESPVPRSVKSGRIATARGPGSPVDLSRILNIEVPIIVQLSERTMPLADILNLTTGSIIEFDKPADSELDLKVNNKRVGSGQAVKVGENFGLRITQVGSVRDRIRAMGGP
ncbi:MAG: FliM/FliN family flagellar motor switch protein [Planctomycetes bacterium]|nr:FliM/FliN family flagellar motor switch protein [Planctomycetota bacterium]